MGIFPSDRDNGKKSTNQLIKGIFPDKVSTYIAKGPIGRKYQQKEEEKEEVNLALKDNSTLGQLH